MLDRRIRLETLLALLYHSSVLQEFSMDTLRYDITQVYQYIVLRALPVHLVQSKYYITP